MKRNITAALFAFLVAGIASAQTWEVSIGPTYTRIRSSLLGSVSAYDKQDDDTTLKAKAGLVARFTLNTPGYYGHEFNYGIFRADLTTKDRPEEDNASLVNTYSDRIKVHVMGYNFLLYMMPKGERWRPYLTGGVQMHRYGEPKLYVWDAGKSSNFGANYGAGIKFKLFEHALIRADFRHYLGGQPYSLEYADETKFSGGILQQYEGSIGLSISF